MDKRDLGIGITGLIVITLIVLAGIFYFIPQSYNSSNQSALFTLHFGPIGSVARTLSSASVAADQNVTVTLTIVIPDNNTVYAINDVYPAGFTVVDNGGGNAPGDQNIRFIDIQTTAGSTVIKTYKLKAPSTVGTYNFVSAKAVYCFEDCSAGALITGPSSITVTVANPCSGLQDGNSCGTGKYCCGGTCANAPTNCPTCKYVGNLCSGTSAICGNSAPTTTCGATACDSSYCGGSGLNTLFNFPTSVQSFCNGLGACTPGVCTATQVNCLTTSFCLTTPTPECSSCSTGTANCDSNAQTSCEVNLLTNAQNCGSCGYACTAGLGCSAGACVNSICSDYPTERYSLATLNTKIQEWLTGALSVTGTNSQLQEIIKIVKLWKYCA